MATFHTNVFSAEDVAYLNSLPEVLAAQEKLVSSNNVYFSVGLTDSLKAALQAQLGLDFSGLSQVPMRWIKGDTVEHVDVGRSDFANTYLVYLNDAPGELVLGDATFPIATNTGFVFNEGIAHSTRGTAETARLLLGPMNELGEPVGAPMAYFPTEADALAFTNVLGYSGSYTVGQGGPFGPGGGYTNWRLASNSSGTSSQFVTYPNGSVLNADGGYNLYPAVPCFLEGTQILALVEGVEKYVPIETLRAGSLVKTSRDGYKAVVAIGKGEIKNPGTDERIEGRLYRCSPSQYPELAEDLFITGCHSILVSEITDAQREATITHLGRIFVTDKKYRLIACVDEKAEPWTAEGTYTIWHFALENADERMNYGVYANGGLLVETCSISHLKNKTNMVLQ